MKKIGLIFGSLCMLTALFSCHGNNANGNNSDQASSNLVNIPATANGTSNGDLPKIAFTDTNFDFGNITEGAKVTHIFTFKNEGKADLVITSATASCGCTTPTFPRNVKHPGDTGTVSVTFDSSNKTGKVTKEVTLTTNSQPPFKFLTINANIQPSNN